MKSIIRVGVIAAVVNCGAGVVPAAASSIILNGGFESGFSSWVRVNQVGSDGTFALQSGTVSPVSADPVPAPPQGSTAAMTDAEGPGSHVMYQDFVVTSSTASLSFDLFIGNRVGLFFTANPATVGLDFSTSALNQQARVDILKSSADPFSVAASDVLMNLYQTNPGDLSVAGYFPLTFDLSSLFAANLNNSLRLRFAEVDNVGPFQLGVDDVRLETGAAGAVPEPASLILLGTGVSALWARRRR